MLTLFFPFCKTLLLNLFLLIEILPEISPDPFVRNKHGIAIHLGVSKFRDGLQINLAVGKQHG